MFESQWWCWRNPHALKLWTLQNTHFFCSKNWPQIRKLRSPKQQAGSFHKQNTTRLLHLWLQADLPHEIMCDLIVLVLKRHRREVFETASDFETVMQILTSICFFFFVNPIMLLMLLILSLLHNSLQKCSHMLRIELAMLEKQPSCGSVWPA